MSIKSPLFETSSPLERGRSRFQPFLQSTPIHIVGLSALAALLFLFNLGRGALLDWDEATYAEVAKEVVTSHDWVHLTLQQQPFFSKPPLSVWIQALFFQSFGVTEFWARFESALSGVVIVLVVYAIARRLSGPSAGLFASFALLTMNHFDRVSRQGTTDAPLCLFIFLAIYAYVCLREDRPAWFPVMCAAVGLGAMIKGPAVLVAPMAIAIDWLFRRDRPSVGIGNAILGSVLVVAFYIPWHIWMMLRSGTAFSYGYIGYLLAPDTGQSLSASAAGPLYYLQVILYGAFPWSVLCLFAAASWLRSKQRGHTVLWALAAVVIVGYSCFPTKHQWYILPVYPALAIETGVFLARMSANRRVIRNASVAILAIGILVALVRLAKRQGDPFTNDIAQLATIAKQSRAQEPLLILARPQSQLDTPTALFYSGRRISLVVLPSEADKLQNELSNRSSADAIIQNGDLPYLPPWLQVQSLARNSSASYAVVSRKPPPGL